MGIQIRNTAEKIPGSRSPILKRGHPSSHSNWILNTVPDTLVLAVGQNELLSGVKDGAADVVVMSPTRVHLPSLNS